VAERPGQPVRPGRSVGRRRPQVGRRHGPG